MGGTAFHARVREKEIMIYLRLYLRERERESTQLFGTTK